MRETFKNYLLLAITIAFLASLYLMYQARQTTASSAFVRINEVFEQYEGVIGLNEKMNEKRNEIETLAIPLYRKLDSIISYSSQIGTKAMTNEQRSVADSLYTLINTVDNKNKEMLDSMQGTMMAPIVQEINDYIAGYGQENDLRYVFGNLSNGNIMYGDVKMDITEEIIQGLNKQYSTKLANE